MSIEKQIGMQAMSKMYAITPLSYSAALSSITSNINTPSYVPDNKQYQGKKILKQENKIDKLRKTYNKVANYFTKKVEDLLPQTDYLAFQH